jgi:hypothetical protein
MITDVSVIVQYFSEGKDGAAYSLIAMMASSMICQLVVVAGQNVKKSRSVLCRECLYVVTFLKPMVEAYRVATGLEDDELTISPLTEMGYSKSCELACEAVPGLILQIFILLTSSTKSPLLLVSMAVSTLTTGFTSAMLSYDMDVSMDHRKKIPEFYGFIGDTPFLRGATFIVMILLASLHNLSKTIGIALLMVVSTQVTMLVLAGEMVMFHLVKLMRRDFTSFVPGLEGGLRCTCAVFQHTVVKILVDFTGMIHFRGSKIVGGYLWATFTIEAQLLPFVALEIYRQSEGVNEDDLEMVESVLFVLLGSWVCSVVAFAAMIKREYWHTFIGTQTGWQMVIATYEKTDDPFQKMNAIFTNHISMSQRIKKDVIKYMAVNWELWEADEDNTWFTPGFIEKIPSEYIPERKVAELGGVQRRRSSVGSVREFVKLINN